jgi:hypothetical protein
VGLILLVALPFTALLTRKGGSPNDRFSYSRERQTDTEKSRTGERQSAEDQVTNDGSQAVTLEAVERAAVQFMRRISSDDRPYVFPPYGVNALDDVRRRVEDYSSSASFSSALNSMAVAAPAIAAQARREGIEPGLVIYTALAQNEGGKFAGDPTAAAKILLPDLLSLRKTFGTESADKSLILVAAWKMGNGT